MKDGGSQGQSGLDSWGPPYPKGVGRDMGKVSCGGSRSRCPVHLEKGRMNRAQKVTSQPTVTRIKSDRARV